MKGLMKTPPQKKFQKPPLTRLTYKYTMYAMYNTLWPCLWYIQRWIYA